MPSSAQIEEDARAVLRALATRKNVILAGPPGTGKSRLLNQVRDLFEWKAGGIAADLEGEYPLTETSEPLPDWFPSPRRAADRRVFPTVFDQNTKYRDFMRGLVPKVSEAGAFTVTSGTLYRAAEHARESGHASLVIIDEINRGPAVAAFGSALVGLEADKRLGDDGMPTSQTQMFEILGDQGENVSFALPAHVYVLGAMNEADTSVEPLDVAFLRRFHIHRLEPRTRVLREHLHLPAEVHFSALPEAPRDTSDWYEALVRAYERINRTIWLGRGGTYQLGHGALMHAPAPALGAAPSVAVDYVREAWTTLRAHVDEVFFGNTRAIGEILRADTGDGPYRLEETTFAGQSVRRIQSPENLDTRDLYRLLVAIAAP